MKELEDISNDLSQNRFPRYTLEDIIVLLDIRSGVYQVEEILGTLMGGRPVDVYSGSPLGKIEEVTSILSRITPVYVAKDDETVDAFFALLDDETMSNEEKARKLMGM